MTLAFNNILRLADISTGTEISTWGEITDKNICSLVTQAITGVSNITIAANDTTEQILTVVNGDLDEARSALLRFDGNLTVTKNIIIPNTVKIYHLLNLTTGGGSLVIKPASGFGVTLLQGGTDIVYCDGLNCASLLAPALGNFLPNFGGTMNGQLVIRDGGLVVQSTVADDAHQASIFIQPTYGDIADLFFGNGRGARWLLRMNNTPETGGNVGSDFVFATMDDDNTTSTNVFSVNRATKKVTFLLAPSVLPTSALAPSPYDLVSFRQIQSGFAETSALVGDIGIAHVTLSPAMNVAPKVVCTLAGDGLGPYQTLFQVYDVTASSFNVRAAVNGAFGKAGFNWIAVGY